MRGGGLVAVLLAVTPMAALAQAFPSTPPPAAAATDGEDIVVVGQRGEPYRLTADALRDAMKAHRRGRPTLAPEGRLLFDVTAASGSLDGLVLYLQHTARKPDAQRRIDLPIDAQGRFAIPDTVPADGTWELRANRRRGGVRIRPLVLSPDTTIPDRRFGDLRLECHVLLAFERIPGPLRLMVDGANICASRKIGFYVHGERPLASAMVRWPGHDLALDLRGNTDRLPFGDRSIPGDARLVLAYR